MVLGSFLLYRQRDDQDSRIENENENEMAKPTFGSKTYNKMQKKKTREFSSTSSHDVIVKSRLVRYRYYGLIGAASISMILLAYLVQTRYRYSNGKLQKYP